MESKIEISAFSLTELNRLVQTIPSTDPTSPAYAQLLENIERYDASIATVDNILHLVAFASGAEPTVVEVPTEQPVKVYADDAEPSNVVQFPGNEVKPEPDAVKEPEKSEEAPAECDQAETECGEEPKYTLEDVRKALGDYRIAHPGFKPSHFLDEVAGCAKFSALPQSKYNIVMAKLAELN